MVLAAQLGGCANAKRTYQPPQDHNTLGEIEFVHYLADLPTVSVDEACHAMLILADDQGAHDDFAQRRAALLERGVIREAWHLEGDDLLDQGTLAYMIVKSCGLRGGVNDATFGALGLGDRRYALRTAQWHDMMPYDVPYHAVSGGELLSAISAAAEHLDGQPPVETP